MTLLSVLIVSYRSPQDVARCLEALSRSPSEGFEVVVCENGGADAFARLCEAVDRTWPFGLRLIEAEGNVGFAGGVNRAMAAADPAAEAYWLLNPDTAPDPDAMGAMLRALDTCDAVGCEIRLPNGRVASYGFRWTPWLARPEALGFGREAGAPANRAEIEASQNCLSGASMIVSRRFVEVAGRMREDYFLYCEEIEWCLRAAGKGLRFGFAPDSRVLHMHGSTTGAGLGPARAPRLPVYLGERNKLLLTRDLYPALLPLAATGVLLQVAARYARRGAWRQVGYALAGWWAGLRNERGAPAWVRG